MLQEEEIEDVEVLGSGWIPQGQPRTYLGAKKGTKEKLVELAATNAALVLSKDRERIKREEGRTIGAVKEICGLAFPSGNQQDGSLRYLQYQRI